MKMRQIIELNSDDIKELIAKTYNCQKSDVNLEIKTAYVGYYEEQHHYVVANITIANGITPLK